MRSRVAQAGRHHQQNTDDDDNDEEDDGSESRVLVAANTVKANLSLRVN